MVRKKEGFWILVVFFGLMAMVGIFKAQIDGTGSAAHDATMGTTMGSMMQQEYGTHLTVAQLLKGPQNPEAAAATAQNHTPPPVINFISELTTAGIYVLTPFILGGVAALLVLWR